jgi:chemotaxis protein methyltransferase CheR
MPLLPHELDLVRRIVDERSGIQLEDGKEYLIESRLETLARLEGRPDASALVDQLRRSPSGPIARKVVEAMTTNETSFFRDRLPFEALRELVLPKLINARSSTRRLQIWCGASSTGQEPYSIAMTIRDHFPELASWNVSILATDLSVEVLEKARSARYSQLEVGRGLPAEMLVRHFERDGARCKLRPALRDMVEFREMNLAGAWPPMPRPDVVFMRNVMIYFDVDCRRRILGSIASMLPHDGYLFLGAGETTINLEPRLRRVDLDRSGCFELIPQPIGTIPSGDLNLTGGRK